MGDHSASSDKEKARVQALLGDFIPTGSAGESFLRSISPYKLSRSQIIAIATIFSDLIAIPLSKDTRKKKALLIKWFDDNLEIIKKWSYYVRLDYEALPGGIPIKKQRKRGRKKGSGQKKPSHWDNWDFTLEKPQTNKK